MPTPINTIKRRKICIGTRNTYNVKIDLRRHPALRSYCRLICELQIHHVEEVSQRARHSIAMLRWSVVNCEIFMQAGWNGNHRINTISTPRIRIKLASAAFKQHPNKQLNSVETTLWSLCDKGVICSHEISLTTFIRWLFYYNEKKNYYDIDDLTVISVILAVILYKHTPCRGVGSSPSESHVKIELWSRLFSAIFALHNLKFLPTWELQHLISGNAGRGSSRSDFAAVTNNQDDRQFAFFLVEFENGGFEVHKDNVVVVAEAVHEFNRILSLIHYPTEEEVNNLCLHTGLVNGTTIHLSTLRPVYDQERSALIYINDEILSFNLLSIDVEENIGNALRLATYLRETVCASGALIRSLLNRQPMKFNYDLRAALPKLPREAVKPREFKTKYTPLEKRDLYNISDESEPGEFGTFC
ncbi:hypothetical protein C2G38_2122302 [Gigaspora rosea]|uniref:Uncharacterized protein n=1 Tax=Gigaspora rosea TaxID=44941 RepID=A0A397U294_9GLOM|nr:hypothetical protein C2G38_2122302 [Gigaspora rosea]